MGFSSAKEIGPVIVESFPVGVVTIFFSNRSGGAIYAPRLGTMIRKYDNTLMTPISLPRYLFSEPVHITCSKPLNVTHQNGRAPEESTWELLALTRCEAPDAHEQDFSPIFSLQSIISSQCTSIPKHLIASACNFKTKR